MDIRQTNCPERSKGALGGGGGGFRGSNIQKLGVAVKRLDRVTSADSSGNFHRLNTSHPSIPKGACRGGGGLGGHTFKSLGKLSNGWTDWHHIWYTSVDSSGNGHRLKQLAPRYPIAAFGGFKGSTFQKTGKLWSNGWTDWE